MHILDLHCFEDIEDDALEIEEGLNTRRLVAVSNFCREADVLRMTNNMFGIRTLLLLGSLRQVRILHLQSSNWSTVIEGSDIIYASLNAGPILRRLSLLGLALNLNTGPRYEPINAPSLTVLLLDRCVMYASDLVAIFEGVGST